MAIHHGRTECTGSKPTTRQCDGYSAAPLTADSHPSVNLLEIKAAPGSVGHVPARVLAADDSIPFDKVVDFRSSSGRADHGFELGHENAE